MIATLLREETPPPLAAFQRAVAAVVIELELTAPRFGDHLDPDCPAPRTVCDLVQSACTGAASFAERLGLVMFRPDRNLLAGVAAFSSYSGARLCASMFCVVLAAARWLPALLSN